MKCLDPGSGQKSRRYGMASAHIPVFSYQKPSTTKGIVRSAILFLAWNAPLACFTAPPCQCSRVNCVPNTLQLAEILFLAGTTGAGRMAPPTSTRIPARLQCVQRRSPRVSVGSALAGHCRSDAQPAQGEPRASQRAGHAGPNGGAHGGLRAVRGDRPGAAVCQHHKAAAAEQQQWPCERASPPPACRPYHDYT